MRTLTAFLLATVLAAPALRAADVSVPGVSVYK